MATPSLTLPDLEAMSAEDVIRWGAAEFGDRLCLTCSWQKQSSVLVHMVSELGLGIDIVELDTHLFFRESYETRDRLVDRYGLNLIRPEIATIAEQHRDEGPNWRMNHACDDFDGASKIRFSGSIAWTISSTRPVRISPVGR